MEHHFIRRDTDVIRFFEEYSGFRRGQAGSHALRRILSLVGSASRLKLIQVSQVPEPTHREWQAEREALAAAGDLPDGSLDRLDFFGGYLGSASDLRLDASEYLGSALVRPGDYRSVLEAWIEVPSGSATCLSGRCTMEDNIPAPDGGPSLRGSITAVPFIEQDTVVGQCSHACTRGATLLLSARFSTAELTFTEISASAGAALTGGDGLEYGQIVQALEASDYNALSYHKGTAFLPLDLIVYHFAESGFPVILGMKTEKGAHCLLVVGHQFDPHSWWPDAELNYYPSLGNGRWLSSAMWNTNFVAHDDNFGPYLNVHRSDVRDRGFVAIVPVPKTVPLTHRNDMVTAESLVAALLSSPMIVDQLRLGSRSQWRYGVLPPAEGRPRLVLRTIYLPGSQVRSHLAESRYPARMRQAYENMRLPAWVYLIDVSVAGIYGSLLKVGEVLIDGTADLVDDAGEYIESALEAILVIHLPGVFWQRPFVTVREPFFVDDDGPTDIMRHAFFMEAAGAPRSTRKRR